MFKEIILKFKIFITPKGDVFYVNGPDKLPAPLKKEEEQIIFKKLQYGDKEAREKLIVHNLRLVVYIAKKFENTGINIEDLVSIGTFGLIKAVNTFSPERNIKLATYASRCIDNEILMHLRKANASKNDLSIDEPINVDWDGNELLLSDTLGTEPDAINKNLEDMAEREMLGEAIEKLQGREKEIMKLRFGLRDGEELTQKEVADQIGISQSYISRIEKKTIKKLKKDMEKTFK